MFQLTADVSSLLRSQFATSKPGRGSHRKYLPYVSPSMALSWPARILNSPHAVEPRFGAGDGPHAKVQIIDAKAPPASRPLQGLTRTDIASRFERALANADGSTEQRVKEALAALRRGSPA